MRSRRSSLRSLTQGAMIAALYVVLTWLSAQLGLSGGVVQLRVAEALAVLPAFAAAAVPGLAVGCLLANLLTGAALWDVLLGTLATLLGALGTRALRRRPLLRLALPIAANTLLIPFVLSHVYGAAGGVGLFMLTVGAGEVLCCGLLGGLLGRAVERYGKSLFNN